MKFSDNSSKNNLEWLDNLFGFKSHFARIGKNFCMKIDQRQKNKRFFSSTVKFCHRNCILLLILPYLPNILFDRVKFLLSKIALSFAPLSILNSVLFAKNFSVNREFDISTQNLTEHTQRQKLSYDWRKNKIHIKMYRRARWYPYVVLSFQCMIRLFMNDHLEETWK